MNLPGNPATVTEVAATEVLLDYGKLYASDAAYLVAYPDSIEAVQALVLEHAGRGIRVRGSGHTFNGCTLPRADELLIRTDHLDWYHLDAAGTIRCGAGALVWDVRDLIEDYGYRMPVFNGGWAGPTLGGYLNAGGFGKGELSNEHGGFWENVLAVTFVDGLGQIQTIERSDPAFPWLFGAYGQYGVVVELQLKMIAEHPLAALTYPKGETGRIPKRQSDDPKINDVRQAKTEKILFWFSLIVSPEQVASAWEAMDDFCVRHAGVVVPDGGWAGPIRDGEHIGYHYDINFHEFNPPLVFPQSGDFVVMGVMSFLDVSADDTVILAIERDFIRLAEDGDFRLYLQAENIGRNVDYREYYGEATFAEFRSLKERFDPENCINRGPIFE